MKTLHSSASCCLLVTLVTVLVFSEVCGFVSAAEDSGFKRGWRPQGRFGKRTLDHGPKSLSDVFRGHGTSRRTDSNFGMDEDEMTLKDFGNQEEDFKVGKFKFSPMTRKMFVTDGAMCMRTEESMDVGSPVYKCYSVTKLPRSSWGPEEDSQNF